MVAVAALATRNTEFYAGRVFQADAIRHMRPSLQPMARPGCVSFSSRPNGGITLVTADQVDDCATVRLIASRLDARTPNGWWRAVR